MRRLLQAGADAARSVDGKTALQWAKEEAHAECARALEEHSSTAAEAAGETAVAESAEQAAAAAREAAAAAEAAEARDAAEAALREAVEASDRGGTSNEEKKK